jgi:hypothetical protein
LDSGESHRYRDESLTKETIKDFRAKREKLQEALFSYPLNVKAVPIVWPKKVLNPFRYNACECGSCSYKLMVIIYITWEARSVGIASSYDLESPGSIPGSARVLHRVHPDSPAYLNSFPVGTGCKVAREADISHPSCDKVKNGGAVGLHGIIFK